MKRLIAYTVLFAGAILLFSCSAPQYFHDPLSEKRQKELRENRSANVFSDIFMGVTSVCMAAAFDGEVEFYPSPQQFVNLKLCNPTNDTMYVNMLTDVYWDKDNYCDFMDIRIPPAEECKVLVPMNANYNVYFSTTPRSDDDEMVEIFTTKVRSISLQPNMTVLSKHRE
jgi:hypothetical protein